MLVMCASTLVKVLNHYSGIFYDKLRVNPADKLGEKGNILVKKRDILQCTHFIYFYFCNPSYLYFNDISQSNWFKECFEDEEFAKFSCIYIYIIILLVIIMNIDEAIALLT